MGELNRQQICAALAVSESTIRRLEQAGLPYTPVGPRSKRYDLDECKAWLRRNNGRAPDMRVNSDTGAALKRAAAKFSDSCKNLRLRVMPSEK